MVLGEKLFTGGTPLLSDVVAKRISFFKTFSEHIQIIGERIVLAPAVQASSSTEFYTVPADKLAFMYKVSFSQQQSGTGTVRMTLTILGEGKIFEAQMRGVGAENNTMSLFSPLPLFPGQVLELSKNNSLTSHEANASIILYEIPKEVAGN